MSARPLAAVLALTCLCLGAAERAGGAAPQLRGRPAVRTSRAQGVVQSLASSSGLSTPCEVGDRVRARFAGNGGDYYARIASFNADGTVTVDWHDGDGSYRIVPGNLVKKNGVACVAAKEEREKEAPERAPVAEVQPSNSTRGGGAVPQQQAYSRQGGVVHFLFLLNDELPHAELWRKFFARAPAGSYSVLAHCKDEAACRQTGDLGIPGLHIVQTTPTWYCHDLVTAMVRLLSSALALDAAPSGAAEKFVFVSESTLPAKPFAEVHWSLTSDTNSDFCIFPIQQWAKAEVESQDMVLLKHHQWVVLNRAHAQFFTESWVPVDEDGAWRVWLREGSFAGKERWLPPSEFARPAISNWCTDEWAFVGTIFGAVQVQYEALSIPGFGGAPLHLWGPHARTTQGRCRTFTFWDEDDGEAFGSLGAKVHTDWGGSQMSCYPSCGARPATFEYLSASALQAMRESEFLFVRKISKMAHLPDFERVILAQ